MYSLLPPFVKPIHSGLWLQEIKRTFFFASFYSALQKKDEIFKNVLAVRINFELMCFHGY